MAYEEFPHAAHQVEEQSAAAPVQAPFEQTPPPAWPGPPPQFTGLPRLKTRRRSRLWPVYAAIAALCWIVFLAHPGQFGFGGFVGNLLISSYAVYVYRGGRWIIF
jgi:hypothetical protein